jgi:hypothetical protein
MNSKFWAGVLIGLGAAIILLFGFRLAHAFRKGRLPPRPEPLAPMTDVALVRDWMTIPYIAHTYGVPDEFLFDALEIPEEQNQRKSLSELNEEYFPKRKRFVIERMQEAILDFQKQMPLPPNPPVP